MMKLLSGLSIATISLVLLGLISLPASTSAKSLKKDTHEKRAIKSATAAHEGSQISMKAVSATVGAKANRGATFGGNVMVLGDVGAAFGSFGNITVSGSASIKELSCGSIRTAKVESYVVQTTELNSPTGTIIINGDLKLMSGASTGSKKTTETVSFLQTQGFAFTESKAASWTLFDIDDFHSSDASMWSPIMSLQSCHTGKDLYLQGPCAATGATTLTKEYSNLPEHSRIRITARVHFIDTWKGETVYLSAGEGMSKTMLWADSARSPPQQLVDAGLALDVCGSTSADARISVPVDVTMQHSEDGFMLSFGSTLQDMECSASYGIDDVTVYYM